MSPDTLWRKDNPRRERPWRKDYPHCQKPVASLIWMQDGAAIAACRNPQEELFTASGCLALNASFEPLTILPVKRALRLVIDRKAEILEVDESRLFRSARRDLPCPLVIRLVRYVHVPRKFRRQVTNTFLFARDGYRCMYCMRHRSELRGRAFLTRDHVIPISRGGLNAWTNVVTACSPCNNRKGSRLPVEASMHPAHEPHEPNYVELVWAVRRITPVQAKYIRMFYGEDVLRALQHAEPLRA